MDIESKSSKLGVASELWWTLMKEVMTPKEAAEYLRVHVRTIYRLAKSGQIPSRRVGGSWRFKKEDVDSWFSETKYSVSRGKRAQRSEGKQQPGFDKLCEGKDQSPL